MLESIASVTFTNNSDYYDDDYEPEYDANDYTYTYSYKYTYTYYNKELFK
jgi:hypothetical protein